MEEIWLCPSGMPHLQIYPKSIFIHMQHEEWTRCFVAALFVGVKCPSDSTSIKQNVMKV